MTANTGLAGFAISGTQNATQVIISEATGVSGNAATLSATFSGVSNPSTAGGVQFYTRITTYTDTAATAPTADGQDFGATAVATVPLFTVNANVQESLVFCVGATVGANCGGVGSAAITLTPDPLTTSAPSYGTAQMGAATNGLSGYSIAYYATNMVSGGNSITKVADGGAVSAAGGEQFGFTMRNQTSGNLNGQGSAASGGSGVVSSPYDSQNSTIAYDVTGPTTVASASGPTSQTTYTMLYAANVAATTEPGGYSATQTFIATATF